MSDSEQYDTQVARSVQDKGDELSTQGASAAPDTNGSSPAIVLPRKRRNILMASLGVSYLSLFMTYFGFSVILLPQQMRNLDATHAVNNLALVTSLSAFATLFVQPIVGVFSDRTRSRFGRRTPWMLFGGIGGGVCAIALQFANSLFFIALAWVLIQVLLNVFQGPMSAIVSDRIESKDRGLTSGITGMGVSLGMTLGTTLAGMLLHQLGVAYSVFGVLIIVMCVAFVLINPDRSNQDEPIEPFHLKQFLAHFFVNPRKHPDFVWAFFGRFFMILGHQAVVSYQLYILIDYIKVDSSKTGQVVSLLSMISMVTSVIGNLTAGAISDRIGRRKIFVGVASVLIGGFILIPILSPTVMGMCIYTALLGLGYGSHNSVDLAMMVDVLPSNINAAKDLGVLNIASNIPQALTPLIAASLLNAFSYDYRAIFVYSAIAVFISAMFVVPIKSVK